MYTQFFGNYLLSKEYVTLDQLFTAMQKMSESHMRLGTLAIHYGFMTAEEVDQVIILQTHQNKKFGELAIENGYLSNTQVLSLLKEQSPDFLLLAQILVDNGVLTNSEMEQIITQYRTDNEIFDLDMTIDNRDLVLNMIDHLFLDGTMISDLSRTYFELLFNNIIRFLGEDFTPLEAESIDAYPVEITASQDLEGDHHIRSYISMDEETVIAFASRYVGDTFTEVDEYVRASIEDFLNLHNGLFVVNISNQKSLEMELTPPVQIEEPILDFKYQAIHFPVLFSFGIVHFIVELLELEGWD